MPTKKSISRSRSRKRYRLRRKPPVLGAPLTGRPKMTRTLRIHNNLTRDCRWFKFTQNIPSNTNGNFFNNWAPPDVTQCLDFTRWAQNWEEFKVLQFSVKLFPAAVGSESLQEAPNTQPIPGNQATFKRGNTISWVDQGQADPTFNSIEDLICRPSARLYNPRRYHKRWVVRPKGNPDWGQLDNDGTIALPDQWNDSRIKVYGTSFTPSTSAGTQVWYYVMISFKVLFRGRQQYHAPTEVVASEPPPSPKNSPNKGE